MSENVLKQNVSELDSDLAKRVAMFLLSRGVRHANRLHIKARGGVVLLQGCVSSPRERGLCISCCQRVAGVLHVIDEISVSVVDGRPNVDAELHRLRLGSRSHLGC